MKLKSQLRTAMTVACVALAVAWNSARADEVPIQGNKQQ